MEKKVIYENKKSKKTFKHKSDLIEKFFFFLVCHENEKFSFDQKIKKTFSLLSRLKIAK
jgi:hypothetical protein